MPCEEITMQPAKIDWINELSRQNSFRPTYAQLVENGLPVIAVDQLAARLAPSDPKFKYLIVPESTYRRRTAKGAKIVVQKLNSEQSEKTARLTRLLSYATEIFGSEDIARQFLNKPHIEFDGKTPLQKALSGESGGVAVELLLGWIKYSVAA